jgi:hypothetical protein
MGRRIDSDAVHSGRNIDQGKYRDDNYVKCSRCGFWCNIDRDKHAKSYSTAGWGIKYPETGTEYNDSNITYDDPLVLYNSAGVNDPLVHAGCPQCGTYLYKGDQ